MIATLKLPFKFDAERLEKDLGQFAEDEWTPHFNQSYYEGDWSVIALRAAKGAVMEIYPDPAAEGFEETAKMARCGYVPEILKAFKCEFETVRFLRLGAGDRILEHRDYRMGFEDGAARIHIPVKTNPQVEFRLNGEIVQMGAGEVWYLNFNLPHSVVNHGREERVHLVVDCLVNDWLREFFASDASQDAQSVESLNRES